MDENVRNRVPPPHTQMYVYIYMQIEFPPFPTREKHPSDRGCFRRAIAEKYFAAALPDAARKSTREETFDLMEYVDSKVCCQMSWRWLQAKRWRLLSCLPTGLLYMLYPFVMVC